MDARDRGDGLLLSGSLQAKGVSFQRPRRGNLWEVPDGDIQVQHIRGNEVSGMTVAQRPGTIRRILPTPLGAFRSDDEASQFRASRGLSVAEERRKGKRLAVPLVRCQVSALVGQ